VVAVHAPSTAVQALERAGITYRLHRYRHDPLRTDFAAEATEALGLDGDQVLKTLVLQGPGELVVAVLAGTARLSLRHAASALSLKQVELAERRVAERSTGYVLGGISPFGQRRELRTLVDLDALGHESVFVSGGRRGLEIELAPADLVQATNAVTAALKLT
jgi:Cys-tRNA(Pro)/Cys-tRNA(Cys) deacylase